MSCPVSVSSVPFVSSLSLLVSPLDFVATGLTGVKEIVGVPVEVVQVEVVDRAADIIGMPAEDVPHEGEEVHVQEEVAENRGGYFHSRPRLPRTPPPAARALTKGGTNYSCSITCPNRTPVNAFLFRTALPTIHTENTDQLRSGLWLIEANGCSVRSGQAGCYGD